MTKHEDIEALEEIKMFDDSMFAYSKVYNDALNMAIGALKAQEPRVMTRAGITDPSGRVHWLKLDDYGGTWRCWTSRPDRRAEGKGALEWIEI